MFVCGGGAVSKGYTADDVVGEWVNKADEEIKQVNAHARRTQRARVRSSTCQAGSRPMAIVIQIKLTHVHK